MSTLVVIGYNDRYRAEEECLQLCKALLNVRPMEVIRC